MLFAWIGFLKENAGPIPQAVQAETIGFLQQPFINFRSVGQLRNEADQRAGMMMIFEVEDRAAAETLVKESPYLKAGLYEDHRLYEYLDEVG